MAEATMICRLGLWLLRHVPMPDEIGSRLRVRVLPTTSEGLVRYVNDDGIRFELDLHEYIQKRIYAYQYYEPECVRAARKLIPAGGTMVDVGANIGQYTLFASLLVGEAGQVIAFEPSPTILQRLHHHIDINHAANVEIIPCAVSDREGTGAYYGPAQAGNIGQGSLVAPLAGDVARSSEALAVDTVRLDTILEERGVGMVDFVKIDFEGHEMAVLRSAESWLVGQRIRALMVEVSPDNLRKAGMQPDALTDYLQGFGYRPMVAGWSGRLRPLRHRVTGDTNVFFLAEGVQP